MGDLSDEQLVAGYRSRTDAKSGETFLNELFDRYYSRVSLWCWRFTRDRDLAADLAQEVFTKVYQHLDAFRAEAKFSTWLYTIARNHCMNTIKARAAAFREVSDQELADVVDRQAEDPLGRLERAQSVSVVRTLIAECLDETEQKVMLLHYGEEIPLAGITSALNLTNSSGAKAYIVSARRKLSRALERWKARGSLP